MTRRRHPFSSRVLAPVRAAAALVALVAAAALLTGGPATAAPPAERPSGAPQSYALLQLNLCLSGLAGCFDDTEYPKVVDEAVARIRETSPDAVTLNEACSGDVERIARATGYEHRFATVIYRGAPLPCRNPGGRGVFGNAVLVDDAVVAAEDAAFQTQLGPEERRWLCVTTAGGVRACTSHLSVAGSAEQAATNAAQCAELGSVLAEGGPRVATVFGGDVNRRSSCAPDGMWTLRDDAATQAPGIQHAYGTRAWFLRPRAQVLPMTYTDHDGLLVTALLRG